MKRIIILICILVMVGLGCSGLQIDTSEPEDIAKEVGQEVTFWVLQNNLDYLDYVQDGLDVTNQICESEDEIDLIEFAEDIIDYAEKILVDGVQGLDKDDYDNLRLVLARLKLYVNATYTAPEDYADVKLYICSFLEGVQESVTSLR